MTVELCRKHGISDATFYNWRAYGGMTVSEVARLRTPEDENRRLKKLLVESVLDVSASKIATFPTHDPFWERQLSPTASWKLPVRSPPPIAVPNVAIWWKAVRPFSGSDRRKRTFVHAVGRGAKPVASGASQPYNALD